MVIHLLTVLIIAPSSQLSALLTQKYGTGKTASQDFWSAAARPAEQSKKYEKHGEHQQSEPIPLNEHISKIFSKRITDFYAGKTFTIWTTGDCLNTSDISSILCPR